MIKLIIFDAEHILYSATDQLRYFNGKLLEFIIKHNPKMIGNQSGLWSDLGLKTMKGKMTMKDAHKELLTRLSIPQKFIKEYEIFDRDAFKRIIPMEKNIPNKLAQLKKMGYSLAVLSDTGHSSKTKKFILKYMDLDKTFDKIFVSSEIGHMKPDKEAYTKVLTFFKVVPKEAIFVGHDSEELDGAKKVGINTISYKGDNADFIAKNFNQILAEIKKLDKEK